MRPASPIRRLSIATFLLLALTPPGARAGMPARDLVMRSLGLSRVSIQALRVDAPGFRIPVDLEGRRVMLSVEPSGLRSSDFRVQVAMTGSLHDVPAPPSRSYRGTVEGMPGSVVGGTIRDGQLRAAIALADGRVFHVQPLSEVEKGARPGLHAVYAADDAIGGEGVCATTDALDAAPPESHSESGSQRDASVAAVRVAEIAFDTDYEFYTLNGSSVNNTVNDIEDIVAQMNAIYERDVELSHTITRIIVRSDAADPYTTSDPLDLLEQFGDHWVSAQTGVVRDVAHMMTGKNLAGGTVGIAALGAICSRSRGYGLSQSRFSSTMSRRVALTAHEVGHNWNARHCDDVSPCRIMCSSLGGCDGIGLPNFEPLAISAITSYASTRTCLQTPQVSVTPPRVNTWAQFAAPAPNPFSGETALSFELLRDAQTELEIYDVAGHRVKQLARDDLGPGWHSISWSGLDEDGRELEAGVYFAVLRVGNLTLTQRLVLLR